MDENCLLSDTNVPGKKGESCDHLPQTDLEWDDHRLLGKVQTQEQFEMTLPPGHVYEIHGFHCTSTGQFQTSFLVKGVFDPLQCHAFFEAFCDCSTVDWKAKKTKGRGSPTWNRTLHCQFADCNFKRESRKHKDKNPSLGCCATLTMKLQVAKKNKGNRREITQQRTPGLWVKLDHRHMRQGNTS